MNSPKSSIPVPQSDAALRVHVERAMRHYFAQLHGEKPCDVYEIELDNFLKEVQTRRKATSKREKI